MQKKTQGRKKIEMKKITHTSSLQVTFSKRRAGLFKKASELCVLTGAETAVIVESPGGRVFAFGHPSVEAVVDQYLAGSSSKKPDNAPINEFDVNSTCVIDKLDKLNLEYLKITKEMEDEKGKKIHVVENNAESGSFWWERPFDDLGFEELEKYIESMEALRNNVIVRADEKEMIRNSSMFNVNQSSTNEGSETLLVKENAGRDHEYGDEQMLPCPPGFNIGSGLN